MVHQTTSKATTTTSTATASGAAATEASKIASSFSLIVGDGSMMTSQNSVISATHMLFSPLPRTSSRLSDNDRLERSGRWLQSIPRDDVVALQQTPEYQDFLRAFDRLGQAHRKVVAMNRSLMSLEENISSNGSSNSNSFTNNVSSSNSSKGAHHNSTFSFLQHLAVDDVILRVFEFLECHALIRLSRTCSRFRELACRSATQRTTDVSNARQLNNVMKVLRAKEQIDGVCNNIQDSHVRVPMLGLSRRIYVTDAGDTEYNGVYYCTGNSGNGFVFTKPRYPERRVRSVPRNGEARSDVLTAMQAVVPGQQENHHHHHHYHPHHQQQGDNDDNNNDQEGLENQIAAPGQILRCIIAKRFSRETILWYMSKEVEVDNDNEMHGVEVVQRFDFWARLMVTGDASPNTCRYPSQTSILSRNGEPAWQALSTNPTQHPPTVELLD